MRILNNFVPYYQVEFIKQYTNFTYAQLPISTINPLWKNLIPKRQRLVRTGKYCIRTIIATFFEKQRRMMFQKESTKINTVNVYYPVKYFSEG